LLDLIGERQRQQLFIDRRSVCRINYKRCDHLVWPRMAAIVMTMSR
jgi:hypothetical protein